MKQAATSRRMLSNPGVLVAIAVLVVVVFVAALSLGSGGSDLLTTGHVIISICAALGLSLLLIAVSRHNLSGSGNELEEERKRRTEAERKANRILESESFLVKASLGLISRETINEVVQHLADEALRLFQVKWAIVGAFPAGRRELEIMGAARHSSVAGEARVKQPISGKDLFRRLWKGNLETIVCNDIASHPDSAGYPEGHPDVKKVIIVPLVNRTMEMIGLFIVGDRLDGGDFTEYDRYLAELLTHYGSAAVARSRAEEDRRTAEQKLQDATREQVVLMSHASRLAALGEMAAVMAHELNQPLGSIRNYLSGSMDELRRKFGNDESILSSLEEIPQLVDRAAGIIKRLREFATINGDNDGDPVQSASVHDVVENTVDLLRPRLERFRITLETDLADDLPAPLCDPSSIEQILFNLVINACDAMIDSAERRLTISARTGADGRTVEVSVADTGPGIPDEMKELIFDPFFTSKPQEARLGLGLSISRSLIREFGGDILVRDRIGQGAVFTFRLPASVRAPALQVSPADPTH